MCVWTLGGGLESSGGEGSGGERETLCTERLRGFPHNSTS